MKNRDPGGGRRASRPRSNSRVRAIRRGSIGGAVEGSAPFLERGVEDGRIATIVELRASAAPPNGHREGKPRASSEGQMGSSAAAGSTDCARIESSGAVWKF